MPRLDVCVEPFFNNSEYEERIEKVYNLGFKSYEFWFHNKRFNGKALIDEIKDFEKIAELNQKYGLTLVDFVFNHPDGGIQASLIDKRDRTRLVEGLEEIIEYAKKVGCKKLISGSGNKMPDQNEREAIENMTEALRELAPMCEREGVILLLEPFNTRVDHPDYFLDDPYVALEVVKNVGSSNVKMLFDIYHMQIMSGNISDFINTNIEFIGHFHIAGVPGRHEPVENELDYRYILKVIDKCGYDGYVGLEYWPVIDDTESLIKTKEYLGM